MTREKLSGNTTVLPFYLEESSKPQFKSNLWAKFLQTISKQETPKTTPKLVSNFPKRKWPKSSPNTTLKIATIKQKTRSTSF